MGKSVALLIFVASHKKAIITHAFAVFLGILLCHYPL